LSGLAKSIQMCFPEAKRSLCTKHLKDNVSEYLKNKISVNNSERHNVVEKIFGSGSFFVQKYWS
jgi:transposase-like protein